MRLNGVKVVINPPTGDKLYGKISPASMRGVPSYHEAKPKELFEQFYGSENFPVFVEFKYKGELPLTSDNVHNFLCAAYSFVRDNALAVWEETLAMLGTREDLLLVEARKRVQHSANVTLASIFTAFGIKSNVYGTGSDYTPDVYVLFRMKSDSEERIHCKFDPVPFLYNYRGINRFKDRPACRYYCRDESGEAKCVSTDNPAEIKWYVPDCVA